jgi:hypothetical protein
MGGKSLDRSRVVACVWHGGLREGYGYTNGLKNMRACVQVAAAAEEEDKGWWCVPSVHSIRDLNSAPTYSKSAGLKAPSPLSWAAPLRSWNGIKHSSEADSIGPWNWTSYHRKGPAAEKNSAGAAESDVGAVSVDLSVNLTQFDGN